MLKQFMGPEAVKAYMVLSTEKSESAPQFKGAQDKFQFWRARIRALLMEKDAHESITLTKQ